MAIRPPLIGIFGVLDKLRGALEKQQLERPSTVQKPDYVLAQEQLLQAAKPPEYAPAQTKPEYVLVGNSATALRKRRTALERLPQTPEPAVHTVQPGETLWGIAQQHLGKGERYPEIRDYPANIPVLQEGLKRFPEGDPRLEKPFGHWIFPGQQFAIPGAEPPEPDLKQEAIRRMLEVKERQLAAPAPPVNAINRFSEASKVVAPEIAPTIIPERHEDPAKIISPTKAEPAKEGMHPLLYGIGESFSKLIEKTGWAVTEGLARLARFAVRGFGAKDIDEHYRKIVEEAFKKGQVSRKAYEASTKGTSLLPRTFLDRAEGWLTDVIDYYGQPEKYAPVTSKTAPERERLRQEAYEQNVALGIATDLADAGAELLALIIQMALTGRYSPQQGLAVMDPLKNVYQHIGRMGAHAVVTTPGGIEDRAQAALYRVAYNITPYISNATGATGLNAVAVDTALNTFLTSPVYYQAVKEAGGLNEESLAVILPQLVMDIGMAWNTRGLPENQARAEWAKRINLISKETGIPKEAIEDMFKQAHTDWARLEREGEIPPLEAVYREQAERQAKEAQERAERELPGGKVAPESLVTRFEEPSKVIGRPEAEKPPEAKPGAIETKPAEEPWETIRHGTPDMMLESGEVVLTSTGRRTTPFPEVKAGSARKVKSTVKAVENWLIDNAIAEAEARGDEWSLNLLKAINRDNITQADKDLAEDYLFGEAAAGREVKPTETLVAAAKPAAPAKAKPAAIEVGQIVYNQKGEALTVVDTSDPSLLTVRNARGTEFKTGRKSVTTEKPVAPAETVPKPVEPTAESVTAEKPEKPAAKITAYSERKSVDTETGKEITIREEHRIRKNNEKLMDELKAKGYPLDVATRPIVEERRYVRDGKPGPWEVFDTHKTRKAALEQMAAAKLTPVSSEYKKYVAGEEAKEKAKEAAIKAEREKEAEKKRRFQEMVSRISGETPVTKMKRGKIQVVLSEGEKTEPFTAYKVSENVYIHKSLEGGKPSRKQDAKWTVTLYPSGATMGTRYSKEEAIAWATALSRSGIDLSLDVKGLKSQIDKVKKLGEAFRRGEMPTPPSKKANPPKDKGIDLQLFAELKKVNPKWTDKERRDITKMIQKLRKVDTKHLRPEYKREIEGLLKDIDLQVFRRTKKKLRRLESTRRFLESNPDAVLPDKVLKELAILNKRRLSEMTHEQIKDIYTGVTHFLHLNKTKNKLTIGNRLKDVKQVVNEAVDLVTKAKPNIKGLGRDVRQINSLVTDKGPGRIKRIWTTRSYLPELMTHMLQGKESGPISQFLYDGINEGYNRKLEVYFSAHDHLQKAIGDTNIDGWSRIFNKKARDVEVVKVELTGDRSIKMTRDDRMEIYLHTKNPFNMRSLVDGGVRFKTSEGTKHKFTKEDIALIVKSMSPSEKRIADAMFEYLNTQQKIDVNDISVRLNGYEIATVEDYWPISRSEIDYKRDPQKELKVFSYRALENMGFLQERKKVTMPLVVRGAFQTFLTNIEDASSYVGLAEPLRNAKTLIQNGRFISELRNRGLGEHYKTLRKYLEYVEGAVGNQSEMDRMALDLLGKFQTAKLALNPWVVMKQPVSYLVAGTEMDFKYLIKAAATKVNWDEIKKYDPQLRYRVEAGAVDREMGELAMVGVGKWFYTGKTFAHRKLTGLIQKADAMAVGRIWNAVKLEIKDKYPDLKGDAFYKKVSERTQQIVNRTQPAFLPHTRSEINRDPSTFWRLFTMFSNQRNKNYNMMIRSWWRYQNSGRTASDKANFMKSLFLVVVASPFILMGIDEMRDKLYKRDTNKSFLGRAVKMVSINLSNIYFVGTVFDSIASKVEQGTWAGYDIDNPIEGLLNQGIGAVVDTVTAIDQIVKGEKYTSGARKGEYKWKITALRAMDKAAGLIADLQGYPYQNVTVLAKGITKHLSPESEFAVDALTRNPQPSDYYKKLWKAYKENDIKRSQQLLELMIEQFDTKWKSVKSSAGYKELSIAEKQRLAKLFIEAKKKARQ